MLGGQAVIANVESHSGSTTVVASVHARTGPPKDPELAMFNALSGEVRSELRLPNDAGSWNAAIILAVVARAAARTPFIAGGDFNLAWRFDETASGRPDPYWASAQFKAIRERGWRRPHLKFHAGEERTLFRGPNEIYQLDHFFTDAETYRASTRCDVVSMDDLGGLSDHAPLLLEIENDLS